jgi:hypothetical protein
VIKTSAVLLLTAGLSAGLAVAAGGTTPVGPICVSVVPFTNILAWFVDTTALGNQFMGTGRDLTTNQTQTVSLFVSAGIAHVGYTTYPDGTNPLIIGGGTIDLATGTGPGVCYRINAGSGCGNGTPLTFAFVTCPPGAGSAPDGKSVGGRDNLQ